MFDLLHSHHVSNCWHQVEDDDPPPGLHDVHLLHVSHPAEHCLRVGEAVTGDAEHTVRHTVHHEQAGQLLGLHIIISITRHITSSTGRTWLFYRMLVQVTRAATVSTEIQERFCCRISVCFSAVLSSSEQATSIYQPVYCLLRLEFLEGISR